MVEPRHPPSQRLAPLLVIGAVAVLAVTALAQRSFGQPTAVDAQFAGLCVLAALTAAYRPGTRFGLALGAAPAAMLALQYSPLAVTVAAPWIYLAAWMASTAVDGNDFQLRRWWTGLGAAGAQTLALCAAAWSIGYVDGLTGERPSLTFAAAAAGGGAYLILLLAVAVAEEVGRVRGVRWVLLTTGLIYEAGGWVIGSIIAATAHTNGRSFAWLLLIGLALLAMELVRMRRRARHAESQARRLRDLQLAGHRIIFGESELLAIARQIYAECRRVVHFSWFHFQLAGEGGWEEGWWAGPEGLVREGLPQPPPLPPPLPGIHKRSEWKVVERRLGSDERTVGRLRLWCDPRRLEEDSIEWLEALLPEMASSIHSALLDREAHQDPLTGLPDRRVLENRLEQALHRARGNGIPAAVVMIDLDRFKQVNDRYGHAVGDRALIAVATLLEEHRRGRDLCCRYGGEEFSVVLEDTDGETALAVAERLRIAVEGFHFTAAGRSLALRISAGVAAYPELHVGRSEELLELADVALYEAKRRGRNRCLLNLGQGRFQQVDGDTVDPDEPPQPPSAPTLFA